MERQTLYNTHAIPAISGGRVRTAHRLRSHRVRGAHPTVTVRPKDEADILGAVVGPIGNYRSRKPLSTRQILPKPLDRIRIADSAKGNAVQPIMELTQINARQAAAVLHLPSEMKPDVVHRAQHAAVAGTGAADHAASLQHPFDLRLSELVPQQRLEQALTEDLVQALELCFL